MTSTASTTDAGALDMRAALTQIDTIAVCVGVVDSRNFRTMLATIAGIARATLRNSAPQETRGDEPVAWTIPGDDTADCNGFIPTKVYTEGEFTKPLYAAPQQSPRLEREVAITMLARKFPSIFTPYGNGRTTAANALCGNVVDAILPLLSPDTAVVSSTECEPRPMVPWELDCQRAVCAAPECECPAVSSTSRGVVE